MMSHLRQKLYKEGKDLTMEKALCSIRVYTAKHKAKGMTANYLKGKGKGPSKGKAQLYNNNKQDSQGGKPPEPRQQGQVWEMQKRNPSARREMPSS